MVQDIFAKARRLIDEPLSSDEENVLEEACASARAELSSRLRENLSEDAIYEQFVRAAAALGVSLYLEMRQASIENFSAGSMSMRRRNSQDTRQSALALRRQAELMLIGYLKDRGFCFKAVRN